MSTVEYCNVPTLRQMQVEQELRRVYRARSFAQRRTTWHAYLAWLDYYLRRG